MRLLPAVRRVFELSAEKILSIDKTWRAAKGTPVYTIKGKYNSRGWTEWTRGFQHGSALLQFDATGDKRFLELGRSKTIEEMGAHVSNIGVHDHGFNVISTYGNLWRLMHEGRTPVEQGRMESYELALKVSGAVQAARWTSIDCGKGFIYSFNGPHSLFIDTMRSLRSLALAHLLGQVLLGERDRKFSLLDRLLQHGETTAWFSIYFGEGRDAFDVAGRVAHESIFNTNDGGYRCPSSQQGYSPFTTWTRGLAWAILGFAEQLEYLEFLLSFGAKARGRHGVRAGAIRTGKAMFLRAALAASDFYLASCCTDGIPVWDTGAPNLHRSERYAGKASNPYNRWEPVDSSAASIAAQGFLRLGKYLVEEGQKEKGAVYRQAGLTIARTLFQSPYISDERKHQGLLLHSVYHRPNGWDYIAPGQMVPNGESSMWGDYHLRELALMILREAEGKPYLTFYAHGSAAPRGGDKWG
jgi:hypothetical protein